MSNPSLVVCCCKSRDEVRAGKARLILIKLKAKPSDLFPLLSALKSITVIQQGKLRLGHQYVENAVWTKYLINPFTITNIYYLFNYLEISSLYFLIVHYISC
jgi:hypothetical protein